MLFMVGSSVTLEGTQRGSDIRYLENYYSTDK